MSQKIARMLLTYHQAGSVVQDTRVIRSGWRVMIPGSQRSHLVACHASEEGEPDGPSCFPDVFVPWQDVEVEVATGPKPPEGRWHRVQLTMEPRGQVLVLTRADGTVIDDVPYTCTLEEALLDAPECRLWVRRAP